MPRSRIKSTTRTTKYSEVINGDCLEVLRGIRSESVDLVVTSPPYNIGKDYEKVLPLEKYLDWQREVIFESTRILKPSGNLCWQVGFTKFQGEMIPLDVLIYPLAKEAGLVFKNRIVWTFGHGMHASKRFSGRHETVLWFAKSLQNGYFNLDEVRVPQKYPGKRHYKGPRKGEYSGNPIGKNPGDVWEIPNVKANHIEKTEHQCQFPIALVQRLIRSLCPADGVVVDPFGGVGTSACAASLELRRSITIEQNKDYSSLAYRRIIDSERGALKFRPIETPIFEPTPNSKLTIREKI